MKNLSVSYHLPKKLLPSVDASFSVSSQNLFTITEYKGLDPEESFIPASSDASSGIDFGAYPSPKTISLGLHVGF